jgi:hypothetical protein
MIFVEPGNKGKATEEKGFKDFRNWWDNHQKDKVFENWPLNESAQSGGGLILNGPDIEKLQNHSSQFYMFAAVQWSDDQGRHQFEWCSNSQPLVTGLIPECSTHNFVRSDGLSVSPLTKKLWVTMP